MNKDAESILKAVQPNQKISMEALLRLLPNRSRTATMNGLRELRKMGFLSFTTRRGHKDGALLQFHKTPLPPNKRDHIKSYTKGQKVNGLFLTQELFTVKAGTYSAKQLEPLAKKVLKQLGYEIT